MARRTTKFQTFAQDIQLATEGLDPKNIAAELAAFAIQERDRVIRNGEASPLYDTFVNGRRGADEASVQPPGPILYVFSYWQPIISFALEYLRKRSPVLTGDYSASHAVMVGGQKMRPEAEIAADEEVTIVSDMPYSRKIEVGHMKMSVPHGVYADARKEVMKRFGGTTGAIDVKVTQIHLPNGYILKGHFTKGIRPHSRTKLRKDTAAGARMTYPALVMRMKGV